MKRLAFTFLCFLAATALFFLARAPAPQSTAPATDAPAPPRQAAAAQTAGTPELPEALRPFADTLARIPETSAFRRELERAPVEARVRALRQLAAKPPPVADFDSLHVDKNGGLFYVCPPPPAPPGGVVAQTADAAPQAAVPQVAAASVPVTSPPVRHSKSGATKKLVLDFGGGVITGKAWNTGEGASSSYNALPYDIDGDTTTFNDTEQANIIEIWGRVAEDYAPFDVDVTTEIPATWGRYTGRALITRGVDANGVTLPSGDSAGGISYTDYFGNNTWVAGTFFNPIYAYEYCSPSLIYHNRLATVANIAEAASHELGHALNLNHDGTAGSEYYTGHGSGAISWGAIMGTPYGKNVTQWSKGGYYNANNNEDDMAILASKLAYRNETIGSAPANATVLAPDSGAHEGTVSYNATLLRETSVHCYRIDLAAETQLAAELTPFRSTGSTRGGNADLDVTLTDAAGSVILSAAQTSPANDTGAAFSITLQAGSYYMSVCPAGTGNPQVNPPTGYTSYGSVGQYFINLSLHQVSLNPALLSLDEFLAYAFIPGAPGEVPPTGGSTAHLPATAFDGTTLSIAFKPARANLLYEVQRSLDLFSWETIATAAPPEDPDNVSVATFTSNLNAGEAPRQFLRVKVSLPSAPTP